MAERRRQLLLAALNLLSRRLPEQVSTADQILAHLDVAAPRLRLRMVVRSWIAAVEAVSLIWLDEGRQPPAEELRAWLVDHFVAVLVASAAMDPQTARVLEALLALELPNGPAQRMAGVMPKW